jgi:prephenate dehydrogenase
MKITIIGLGLIGGSMAIDLKKRKFASHIIGVDNNVLHANIAKQNGIVDELLLLKDAIPKSDLIILAVPVNIAHKILPDVLNMVDNQIVTDVCSTKARLAKLTKKHAKRGNYVASHPMAGTENSGPWAAESGLFDGKACIICNPNESHGTAMKIVSSMYETLNMRIINMDAESHDVHAAYVSHISHISSFALALTVLEKEQNEKNIFDLASGGFDSTVRLAKSNAEMWTPIFMQNHENVIEVLETYIHKLNGFKEALENKSIDEMDEMINQSNKIRKILN